MGEPGDKLPASIRKSIAERIKQSSFVELNPLPENLLGLVEWLFSCRWDRLNLETEEISLTGTARFRAFKELAQLRKSLKQSEDQCRRKFMDRLADASKEELQDVRRNLQRRRGDDVPVAQDLPAAQMEAVALRRKIQAENLEQFWAELRAAVDETISRRFAVKKRKPVLDKRKKVIRKAVKDGLTRLRYAQYLVVTGLETPASWQKNGCAKSYVAAYGNPHWRQMIHKERSRVKAGMKP